MVCWIQQRTNFTRKHIFLRIDQKVPEITERVPITLVNGTVGHQEYIYKFDEEKFVDFLGYFVILNDIIWVIQ